jgi:hypothetical protein
MDQPHLISLNLIDFAPSCGRLILGGSLPLVSFVFSCSFGAYVSIRGSLLVLWQCMMCLAKVWGWPAKVRPAGLLPLHDTSPELPICITFPFGLQIG